MSSFIVAHKMMNKILTVLSRKSRYGKSALEDVNLAPSLTMLGRRLLLMNIEATRQRYHGSTQDDLPGTPGEQAGDYVFKEQFDATNVQGYKALQCFLYQCSEGDVPKKDLFKRMQKVSNVLAHRIVNELPAYDAAEWG